MARPANSRGARPAKHHGVRPDGPVSRTVAPADRLPLTCTRSGACCHTKSIRLNPWELACLARARGITPREFCDRHTEQGGTRLRREGAPGWGGLTPCGQYEVGTGCAVHAARPLVCRLYPFGRRRHGEEVRIVHEGARLPCLDSCPEVGALPSWGVADYLAAQELTAGETALEGYLGLMQDLADGAFVLLLDTPLAAGGDRETLPRWRTLGAATPHARLAGLPAAWLDRLILLPDDAPLDSPALAVQQQHARLQAAAQQAFGGLTTPAELRDASCLMMALALHLGHGLGAAPAELAAHWIATARQHGARG